MWDRVFYNNDLISVTISDSITSIWAYAFYNNDLISVTIPDNVTSIWTYAFYDNNLIQENIIFNCTVLPTIWSNAFSYNTWVSTGAFSCTQ